MQSEERKDKKWIVENIPQELKALPNWVGFKFIPQEGKKPKKDPINVATGGHAKSNDSKTWRLFDEVIAKAETLSFDAIGIAVIAPYIVCDIDHSVLEKVISPLAKKIISAFPSYTEYSPSKTGIHVVGKGKIPRDRKFTTLDVEMYSGSRFFTFTGDLVPECPQDIREVDISKLYGELEQMDDANKQIDALFKRIRKSNDDTFFALYEGKWQDSYPSQSEADLALCNKLAFWTGKDPALMDLLFRRSGLMRPKWDEKHFSDGRTYGQSLIEKAVESCTNSYHSSGNEFKHKPTQGEIITRDCEDNSKDFFRDQHGNSIIVLPVGGHLEVCPTSSTSFRNWTAIRYREKYGVPPKTDAINQAKVQIEARCAASRQVELFNRVGWHDNKIFYDLTTADHKGVEITPCGWRVVYIPSIFRRYQHQAEQVVPVAGCDPNDFLRFCNISLDDRCLFMALIASYFIPNIPHVILSQTGEQGSGKSNNSRKIKSLVDPSRVTLISSPKDLEHAQMIGEKHWLISFDNISRIPDWLSDYYCRGVTGEGDMKRSLYTNDDEFIRSYRRCFVLNGIGSSMYRPDLLDRSIIFEIPILKSSRPENAMNEEWHKSLPGILGGFFTVVSKAMSRVSQVTGHDKFRMSDFAQWGGSLAEALGYSRDEFFKKYQESVDRKWQDTAEDSVFAKRITEFLEGHGGYWSGSPAELLSEIKPEDDEKGIPKTAKWLSNELVRIAPVMRNVGIDIIKDKREGGTGRRIFVIKKCERKTCEDGVRIGQFCEDGHEVDSDRPF